MTIEERRKIEAHAVAIQTAAQAAARAETGEFTFDTREEVIAFVNALPSGVKVRWAAETVLFQVQRYRVTFWRSFWNTSTRKLNSPVE